jgi:hypothetical protein
MSQLSLEIGLIARSRRIVNARIAFLVTSAMVVTSWNTIAQERDEKIGEIIERVSKARPPIVECYAGATFMDMSDTNGGFTVVVEGPVGRIGRAAAEAKKMYKPFTITDVTDEMAADIITVTATPSAPTFGPTHLAFSKIDNGNPQWHNAPLGKHAVIKTKPKKGETPMILQPMDVTLVPTSWSNAMGGTFAGQGVLALFDVAAFRALPPGDLDIAIISDIEAERRCKIGKNDVLKVQ